MSKKDKKQKKHMKDEELYSQNIRRENIAQFCTEGVKIFGANNNRMRHVPFLEDGLKPGERRICYALYAEAKALPNERYEKVDYLTGLVLLYHPHGPAPIGKTLVKLGQPWSNLEPLIDGHGNYGSWKGSNAAAGRYIEAKLTKYAYYCFFKEFDSKIVDMVPNYNRNKMEPEYLPARYPNVLINHSFGIGYGVAIGIPTYNLREVLELTIKLLEDPDYDDIYLVPDIPTGANVVDEGQFKSICDTGKGKFKMRAKLIPDYENSCISIQCTPMHTRMVKILPDIIKLIEDKKILGFIDFKDCSSENKLDYRMLFKPEIDLDAIIETLYKKTELEKTFSVNYTLVENYNECEYNMHSLLSTWILFRKDIKRRQINHIITKAREKYHTLEILLYMLNKDNAERTLRLVKKTKKKELKKALMNEYGITSLQANIIYGMGMSAFSEDSYDDYKEESEIIMKEIKKHEKIIRSNKKIDAIIKDELLEGIELFGKPRKSKVITVENKEVIKDSEHLIVLTTANKIKKLPNTVENIGNIDEGDYPMEVIHMNNRTELLIFDSMGKVNKLPIHALPDMSLEYGGEELSNHIKISGTITEIMPKPLNEVYDALVKVNPLYLLMITKKGVIKKTNLEQYMQIRSELLAINLKDDDELVSVKLLYGNKEVVIYTNKGFGTRFNSDEIKETGRVSIGVKAMPLEENEFIVGMEYINKADKFLFMLTDKGNGKKCPLKHFSTMTRNDKPLRLISLNDNEEIKFVKPIIGKEKYSAFLIDELKTIDMIEDVCELPRLSKGKKVMGVRKGNSIIGLKKQK